MYLNLQTEFRVSSNKYKLTKFINIRGDTSKAISKKHPSVLITIYTTTTNDKQFPTLTSSSLSFLW